jgi:sugar transferase (PEP-CTERM system associated)
MVRIFKHYVPVPILVLGAIDGLILLASIKLSVFLRYVIAADGTWSVTYGRETLTFYSVIALTMFALGLYQREYLRNFRIMFMRVATSFTVAFIALSLLFYVIPDILIWRSAVAIAFVLAAGGVLGVRYALVRMTNFERFKRNLLVLGAGPRAARIEALHRTGNGGFSVVGYVPLGDCEPAVPTERQVSHVELVPRIAHQYQIDEIVVAAEDCRERLPTRALLECKLNGVKVIQFPSFWERETGTIDLDALNPSWLIFSDGFSENALQAIAKRLIDIGVSLGLLLFTLPLLVATAMAVRLESRGPVFYRQERMGRGARPFMLLKFRSMAVDAEKDGPQWSEENDTRVTRVGAFIRKTRIDELPQLLNVLMGDMSLVGPRPERPQFVDELAEKIHYYLERHRVKPGITGWAQICYPYGASVEDARRKLEYDLYYLKNYGVLFDLTILIQTARVVLWPGSVRSQRPSEAAAKEQRELDARTAA